MTNVVKAVVGTIAEEAGIQHSTIRTAPFSVTVGVNNTLDCKIQLSPVPAKDFLNLHIENCANHSLNLQVIDILGNILLSKEVTLINSDQINLGLQDWAAGVYFLKLSDGEEKLSRKFIVGN